MSHQGSVEYGSGLEFSNLLNIILFDAAKFGEIDIIVFINVVVSLRWGDMYPQYQNLLE